jgi:hypothetical protein
MGQTFSASLEYEEDQATTTWTTWRRTWRRTYTWWIIEATVGDLKLSVQATPDFQQKFPDKSPRDMIVCTRGSDMARRDDEQLQDGDQFTLRIAQ